MFGNLPIPYEYPSELPYELPTRTRQTLPYEEPFPLPNETPQTPTEYPNIPLPTDTPQGVLLTACRSACFPNRAELVNGVCRCVMPNTTQTQPTTTTNPTSNCGCSDCDCAATTATQTGASNQGDPLAFVKANPLIVIGAAALLILLVKD